ncbi:hypothetical protein BXZ70DRAFT_959650 [Cristinia sonorae]|uniref:DUF6532 domain-containing protein n=1 Tax=Cristinia sonorae TaxID=1940300 RepID=A0A8K0XKH8_9AGAR|nr:hypothetical protein BXZ70DRAFT_959650 [Cristinia sonorae]
MAQSQAQKSTPSHHGPPVPVLARDTRGSEGAQVPTDNGRPMRAQKAKAMSEKVWLGAAPTGRAGPPNTADSGRKRPMAADSDAEQQASKKKKSVLPVLKSASTRPQTTTTYSRGRDAQTIIPRGNDSDGDNEDDVAFRKSLETARLASHRQRGRSQPATNAEEPQGSEVRVSHSHHNHTQSESPNTPLDSRYLHSHQSTASARTNRRRQVISDDEGDFHSRPASQNFRQLSSSPDPSDHEDQHPENEAFRDDETETESQGGKVPGVEDDEDADGFDDVPVSQWKAVLQSEMPSWTNDDDHINGQNDGPEYEDEDGAYDNRHAGKSPGEDEDEEDGDEGQDNRQATPRRARRAPPHCANDRRDSRAQSIHARNTNQDRRGEQDTDSQRNRGNGTCRRRTNTTRRQEASTAARKVSKREENRRREQISLDSDEEVACDQGPAKWPKWTNLHFSKSGKVNKTDQDPRVEKLLDILIAACNHYAVFENAYPELAGKDPRLYALLIKSAEHEDVDPMLRERIKTDTDYAKDLYTVGSNRISNLRGKIARSIMTHVDAAYHISKTAHTKPAARTPDEIKTRVEKLRKDRLFTFSLEPGDELRRIDSEPYGHPFLAAATHIAFFSTKSCIGSRHNHVFDNEDEPEIPTNMLALVATVIDACLDRWRDGTLRSDGKFEMNTLSEVWLNHCNFIAWVKERAGPAKSHRMLASILADARSRSTHTQSLQARTSIEDHTIDFANMRV